MGTEFTGECRDRNRCYGIDVLKGHQVDGLSQFLVADGTVSFSYGTRLVSVAENGLTDLWVHSGPTGIGFPGVAKTVESGWWLQAYGRDCLVHWCP